MIDSRFEALRFRVQERRNTVEIIKEGNRRAEELQKQVDTLQIALGKLAAYKEMLENILAAVKVEDANYKNRRLSFLQNSIKHNLDLIFPEDDYTIKLTNEVKRGKPRVALTLSKDGTKFTNPKNSSGGLQQQLISFSACMAIIDLLDKNKFFIDEAFSAGSPENQEKIGKIINSYYSAGTQMILISQGSSLYQDLPRNEIHLKTKHGKVYVADVIDWRD